MSQAGPPAAFMHASNTGWREMRALVRKAGRGRWLTGVSVLAFVCAACSSGSSAQPPPVASNAGGQPVATTGTTPPADRIPVDLALLGGDAEELFDAAYAADWDVAQEAIRRIHNAQQRLAPLPDADLASRLDTQIRAAGEHVQDKLRMEAMDDANAMSRIVAELTKHYVTGGAPNAAMLLGYYGRQLEIGLAGSRPEMLAHARTDLKTVWNTLRPDVEHRGDSEDAKRFTDVIVALDGAKRPSDYVAPTRAELAEASRIEKLFE